MKKMRPKQAIIVNVVLRKNVLLSCFCLNRLANGLMIIMLDTTLSISTRGSEQKGLGE
jgi:hypothetical protein